MFYEKSLGERSVSKLCASIYGDRLVYANREICDRKKNALIYAGRQGSTVWVRELVQAPMSWKSTFLAKVCPHIIQGSQLRCWLFIIYNIHNTHNTWETKIKAKINNRQSASCWTTHDRETHLQWANSRNESCWCCPIFPSKQRAFTQYKI